MAFQYQRGPQNPYGGPLAPAIPTQSLLAQVLGFTAIGLCITALAAYLTQGFSPGIGLVAMIVGFVLLFVINSKAVRANEALSLTLFYVFTFLEGIGIGPVVGQYVRRFQGILTIALLGLVVVGIVSAFVHFIHPQTYAWITLVIFAGLVLIDFARIRAGGDGLTPVQIAVSIYLDAINIFLALLQIFGGRRSSD
jgi:FtsH-binding integral membrane protein